MKEGPILFSGAMVRAILAGRKTQTRRLVKPQPEWIAEPYVPFRTKDADPSGIIRCRFGLPGDRLWVKETRWRNGGYVATDPPTLKNDGKIPSIHMPKWASRIKLEICSVSVERLNDISTEDARAEGITEYGEGFGKEGEDIWRNRSSVENFRALWESICGEGSWAANPWVWVLELRRVEGT